VVVTSIATATPAVALALSEHLPWPAEEIVRRLYQAPNELLRGLSAADADAVVTTLTSSGLEAVKLEDDAPFTPGDGSWDVAVFLTDAAATDKVLKATALFLGVATSEAARVLFASPPLLIGSVSAATVAAVRALFEPLGVEVHATQPDSAQFDLCLPSDDVQLRARVSHTVTSMRLTAEPAGVVVAHALNRRDATALWNRLDRSIPVRLMATALHRWDVWLETVPDADAARGLLATNYPDLKPATAQRLLQRLPVVVNDAVSTARRDEIQATWASIGATTSVTNVSFQSFHLVVEAANDPELVASTVAATLGRPVDPASFRHLPVRIPGPFPRVQVRWLRERLRPLGARIKLEEV
jgi:hypothetical protein